MAGVRKGSGCEAWACLAGAVRAADSVQVCAAAPTCGGRHGFRRGRIRVSKEEISSFFEGTPRAGAQLQPGKSSLNALGPRATSGARPTAGAQPEFTSGVKRSRRALVRYIERKGSESGASSSLFFSIQRFMPGCRLRDNDRRSMLLPPHDVARRCLLKILASFPLLTTVRRRPDRSRPRQAGPRGHACTDCAARTAPARTFRLRGAHLSKFRTPFSATRPAFAPPAEAALAAKQNQGGPGGLSRLCRGIISPGGVRGGAPLSFLTPFHSIRGGAPLFLSDLHPFLSFCLHLLLFSGEYLSGFLTVGGVGEIVKTIIAQGCGCSGFFFCCGGGGRSLFLGLFRTGRP